MAVMMTAFYLTFAGALSMASALLLNYIVTCSSDKLGNSLVLGPRFIVDHVGSY